MKYIYMLLILILLSGCSETPRKWRIMKEGTIKKIEYNQGSFTVHPKTMIYFKDGSTFILGDYYSIPYKNIKILQDQYWNTKFEEIK